MGGKLKKKHLKSKYRIIQKQSVFQEDFPFTCHLYFVFGTVYLVVYLCKMRNV